MKNKMYKLKIIFLATLTAFNSYADNCSYGVLDSFKDAVKSAVYLAENIDNPNNGFDQVLVGDLENEKPYPELKEIKDCLVAISFHAAPESCVATLALAERFALSIRNNEVENPYGLNATIIPNNILDYYATYTAPTSGGYFGGEAIGGEVILQEEEGLHLLGDAQVIPEVQVASYDNYFTSLASIAEKCKADQGVPVHKPNGFNPLSSQGYAIVDVFKAGILSCSFMVEIENSKIHIKVPDSFKKCVKAGDVVVTRIEQRNLITGLLDTKTVAGDVANFVNTKVGVAPRVSASTGNNEIVSALMRTLDLGLNFTAAAQIDISKIDFDNVASLDPTIFKIVAVCEYGVDPLNYQSELEEWYLNDWNDMEGDVVSANNGNNGGYLRAMYFHQLQNSKTFPHLAKLHQDIKNGIVSDVELWNWENNAMAVCYMNYPTDWVSDSVIDYVSDGILDDSSTLPSWFSGVLN